MKYPISFTNKNISSIFTKPRVIFSIYSIQNIIFNDSSSPYSKSKLNIQILRPDMDAFKSTTSVHAPEHSAVAYSSIEMT